MWILRSAEYKVVSLENKYEAGIAAYEVCNEVDDLVEHLVQGICCGDASAEIMQEIKCGIKV